MRGEGLIPVVGIGAGGHAKVVIEILRQGREYEVVQLLDSKRELWGSSVLGVPVTGDDSLLPALTEHGIHHAFIGVGAVDDTAARRRLYCLAISNGLIVIDAIHPAALISSSARYGNGATIMAGAIINACSCLGKNVIVNTGAIVEHDCSIGDHAHIATGARMASTVHVGEGSHVGIGASVRQCIRIGACSVVGAGSVVVSDVPDGVVVVGVPARILRRKGLE
jgi:sugar O-acyltransferase (sialic acid O-acetyltransferase NeuD family)